MNPPKFNYDNNDDEEDYGGWNTEIVLQTSLACVRLINNLRLCCSYFV